MTVLTPIDTADAAPLVTPGVAGLVAMSERFAAMHADDAERLIDAYVVQAVAEWRVADATFWQRVKFRARLLRATARGRQGPDNKGEVK